MLIARGLHADQKPPIGVSINAADSSQVRFQNQCWAGVRFNADGGEDEKGNTDAWDDNGRGNWLDLGDAENAWIERTINSGGLNDEDAGSGRLQMNTSRAFSVTRDTEGIEVCNITFTAWDAASGGNQLDTQTLDIKAELEV